MRGKFKLIGFITVLALLLIPAVAMAAGGGGAPIVIVSDTRDLEGILKWWGNLYNDSHAYFTMLTCVLIPAVGVIFGVIADLIMSNIGIDLHSKELPGH
ncbi:DVU0150 family protein [Megalodesulfovibrio paquesii]